MTARRVIVSPQAERDIRQATAWYRKEGGSMLASRWNEAVRATLSRIGMSPKIGANRYAVSMNLPGLRFSKVERFPYMVFYIEYEAHIDVGRVLHAQRDIPAWLGDAV